MSELKKLIINGSEYTVTDDTKVPVPATAKVGQTLVVTRVDEEGRPTGWKAADHSGIVTAFFESTDDSGECYMSTSHTASQLINLVKNGVPVVAVLRDQSSNMYRIVFCFAEGNSRIVIGDCMIDGGWQHCVGQSSYYQDGDAGSPEIGNELWVMY